MLVYAVKFYDASKTQVISNRYVPALSTDEAIGTALRENPIFVEKNSPVDAEVFTIPGYIVEAKPEGEHQLYSMIAYDSIADIANGLESGNIELVKLAVAKIKDGMDGHVQS